MVVGTRREYPRRTDQGHFPIFQLFWTLEGIKRHHVGHKQPRDGRRT
jgi:hypothetical protein